MTENRPDPNPRKREGSHDSAENPSKRSPFHPVSVKCLVPHQIAGKLLGKGGDRIRALKEICPKLFMSKNDEYFPHTDERVLFVGGTLDQVHEVLGVVQEKISGASQDLNTHQLPPKWRLNQMKIVVANSTCSKIIGNKGDVIKQVRESTDTKITTTPLKQIVGNERVVTLSGDDRDVMEALRKLLALVEEDKEARLVNDVSYKKFQGLPEGMMNGAPRTWNIEQGPANPYWDNRAPGGSTWPVEQRAPPSIHPYVRPTAAASVPEKTSPSPSNPLAANPLAAYPDLGQAFAGLQGANGGSGNIMSASILESLGGLITQIARQQRMNNGYSSK